MSKFEKLFREVVKHNYYGEVIYNYRPNWLKNPKTEKCLELDIYLPKERMAFEVQGYYHIVSDYQKEKDDLKMRFCKKRGIKLIEIKSLGKKYLNNKYERILFKKENLPYWLLKKIHYYNSWRWKKKTMMERKQLRRRIQVCNWKIKWQKKEKEFDKLWNEESRKNRLRMKTKGLIGKNAYD